MESRETEEPPQSRDEIERLRRDIERLQEENLALRDSESFLRLSQEIASIGSWDWDIRTGQVRWSDEMFRIFGRPRAEFDGRLATSVAWFHPDDVGRVETGVRRVLETHEPTPNEFRILRPDGSIRHVYGQGHIVLDENQQAIRMVGTILDISDRKRLEEQLRESQKMDSIGRLAGGVAHDFNNLLAAILHATEQGFAAPPGSPEVHDALKTIALAAERAQNLTRQLLAFARRQIVELKMLALSSLVASMQRLLESLLGESITLHTRLADELWPICGDPSQIEQLLMNLCVNARDAMPGGGEIHIHTENLSLPAPHPHWHGVIPPGDYVCLTVRDTGLGMSEHVLRHIFEPFFTTKGEGGLGLGLASAYGMVKQIGRDIAVQSRPGEGAEFTAYFPRAECNAVCPHSLSSVVSRSAADRAQGFPAAPKPAPRAQEAASPAHREKILLVEDNDLLRQVLIKTLNGLGYQVEAATDGLDALQKIGESKSGGQGLDLAIVDVIMPRMGGLSFAQSARKALPEIKILFVTGYSDDWSAQLGPLQTGMAFLQKPFTPQELAAKVREILDSVNP